jgi:hypothetical protein
VPSPLHPTKKISEIFAPRNNKPSQDRGCDTETLFLQNLFFVISVEVTK